jgi:hypothetical protein
VEGAGEVSAEVGDRRPVRVCECGVIASGWAKARCGRDLRTNLRYTCPSRLVLIEIVADLEDGAYVDVADLRGQRP